MDPIDRILFQVGDERTYKHALTIAGSDSGGGAGIQADIKTFSALQCYGMSVITAITAQNTIEVTDVMPIPTEMIVKQLDAVLSDIGADAIKIGMVYTKEAIMAIKQTLAKYCYKKLVIDPVMVSTSGHKLLEDDAIQAINDELIPTADVVTPNIPEAELLTGVRIQNIDDRKKAAKILAAKGCDTVLIKGGHAKDKIILDSVYFARIDEFFNINSKWIDTPNKHGTGCTLSSAITAVLAYSIDEPTAITIAKNYTDASIKSGSHYQIGRGHGPVHHFHDFWL